METERTVSPARRDPRGARSPAANDDVIDEKVRRLMRGSQPRVLDLFSGCGGLSLGFQRAGCVSVGGIEIDPLAAASYARNFHPDEFERHSTPLDITSRTNTPEAVLRRWGHESPRAAVDIIVGGPPCPAFTVPLWEG